MLFSQDSVLIGSRMIFGYMNHLLRWSNVALRAKHSHFKALNLLLYIQLHASAVDVAAISAQLYFTQLTHIV